MITSLSNTSANLHIETLEKVFAESKTSIDWLVIAHSDSRMVQALSSELSGESAAILELSQEKWDDGPELAETIEWALERYTIKNLLFAGHSQSGVAASRASLVGRAAPGGERSGSPSSYDQLLAGARRTTTGVRNAQARFAGQIRQVASLSVVEKHVSSGDLTLHGLFYQAESGLFLGYHMSHDRFAPLM